MSKRKRVTKYNANDTRNSKLNNDNRNNSTNTLTTCIKPSYPSNLTANDLIKKNNNPNNNKPKTFPNAFIAYRMALIKEYNSKGRKLPPMSEVSKIAKNYWDMESIRVKNFYESLVKDAKSIYKQNNIQIMLDKHMGHAENNQENGGTEDVESERPEGVNVHPIQDTDVNFSNNDNINLIIEYNRVLVERCDSVLEQNRILEQYNRVLLEKCNSVLEQNRVYEQVIEVVLTNNNIRN
jgi:hypothetical protein